MSRAKQLRALALFGWLTPIIQVGFTEPDSIVRLARNNPQAIVVIDEIYGEYAPRLSVLPYVNEVPNLMVCKGFSKVYGMAVIRLGYVVASPELLARLRVFAPWANVALPSCGMAAIALEHKDYHQDIRDSIVARKQQLTDWLTSRGLQVVPSFINTIVVKVDSAQRARGITESLAMQHIIINAEL